MDNPLAASAKKVQHILDDLGLGLRVVEMPGSTRTAEEAARAVGCEVEQIVKSIVLKTKKTKQAVMVTASGANRISLKRIASILGEAVRMADPDFVREKTGYAIGGVPPVGHREPIPVIIDEDLMGLTDIWAAAGTPQALFRLRPDQLQSITSGQVAMIRADPPS